MLYAFEKSTDPDYDDLGALEAEVASFRKAATTELGAFAAPAHDATGRIAPEPEEMAPQHFLITAYAANG